MRNKGIAVLLLGAILALFSCTKLETDDLTGSFWNGTLTATSFANGEHADLAFDFKERKADFTYLPYGELKPEEGVMLYSMTEDTFTIQSANEILNGEWKIASATKLEMILERTDGKNTFTIKINKK